MKKIIYISMGLGVAALSVYGQSRFSTGDRMQLHTLTSGIDRSAADLKVLSSGGMESVEVIVRYSDEATLAEIESKGGEVVSRVGYKGAIVRVSPDIAEEIAATRGITGVALSVKAETKNDKSKVQSNVPDVWSGAGLDSPYTGKGVLLGIYDVGIDPNHKAFQNVGGQSRAERVWSYSGASASPSVYDTPTKIKYYTTDSRTDAHGTHVMGIMTGSFMDTVSSSAPDYRGVAPGARLVCAGGAGYLTQILDAMERAGKYANEQEIPCVANLSFGDNVGPHDGSDAFTATLNEIADKYDMVLCVAAGNERGDNVALVRKFTEENTSFETVLKRGYRSSGSAQAGGQLQVWSTDAEPLEVIFELVSSENPDSVLASYRVPTDKEGYLATDDAPQNQYPNATLDRSNAYFSSKYSRSVVGGLGYVDPANNRYVADMYVTLNTKNQLDATTYNVYFRVKVKGKPGQKAYLYCDGIYMTIGSHNKAVGRYEVPDGFGSNSNMASGKSTLCVGSYVSANRSSSGYPSGVVGQPSYFSSYGETGDGREMPDVCAPGQVIVSARNTYCTSSAYSKFYTYKDNSSGTTYAWTTMAGTSQASPHMAGIAALVRSANPQLNYKEVKDIIRNTAVLPENGKGWGRGRADAYAAVLETLKSTSVDELIENKVEGTLIRKVDVNRWEINVPAENGFAVVVCSLDGKIVESADDNASGYTLDCSSLQKGIYVVSVRTRQGVRSEKLLVK